MKLWLDDIRPCPDGYLHAHSVSEAIKLLEELDCEYASLDHDLGDYAEDGGDGFKLVLWMAEHDRWPSKGIRVHSANPPGMARMLADIDHYGPYPPGNGISRGTWPLGH
ncbi:MAG: cyclic-phosphate processing receiver domain-containing protein [Mycobacteriales bacterium]